MAEEGLPLSGPPPTRRSSRTPLLVGLTAFGILAVAFVAAILRSGGESARFAATPGPPSSAVEPPPAVPGEGIQLVSPIGRVPHGTVTMYWNPEEEFTDYEVTILDNQARLLWRSRPVKTTSVTVPGRAAKAIAPGATHFWLVTGHRKDGTESTTSSVPFILSE